MLSMEFESMDLNVMYLYIQILILLFVTILTGWKI